MNVPVGKKIWFVASIELESKKGMAMVITRAHCGLKTGVKAWSEFFGKLLKEMRYIACITNLDVWVEPQTNNDGYSYWSYILVYVDDCLAIHCNPGSVMEDLKSCYKLMNDTYGKLKRDLGVNVEKY